MSEEMRLTGSHAGATVKGQERGEREGGNAGLAGQSLLTKGRGISLEGVSRTERLGRAVLPSPFEGMLEGNSNKSTGSEIFLTYDLPFTKISVCMKK